MSNGTEPRTPPVLTAGPQASPIAVTARSHSPSFVDLCAGAGGLTLGMMAAGMRHLLGAENDPFAIRSYQANTGAALELDLTREDAAERIRERLAETPDAVIGGPPCQGFSLAGRRDPNDSRSELVFHFVRVATALRPRWIVMENVPGIVSMGTVLEELIEALQAAGYRSRYGLHRASDYGAATMRTRLILMAWRADLEPPPDLERTHRNPDGSGLLTGAPVNTVRHALFDATGALPEPPEGWPNAHVPTRHKAETLARMRAQGWGEPLYESFSHSWVRLHPDRPAPTLKENHGAVAVHPTKERVITPREMARIQGFTDDWVFCGPKSAMLKQVGNAVPPFLGRAIGLALMRAVK